MLRKLALVMAISPAIWLSTASALGLGEIDVQSKLNQRLNAVIPLTDLAPDEAETLQVGLAQGDAYDKAGLTRSDYLNALNFTVVTDDGAPRIVISGKQIAREPLLNLLLDVRGRNGRIQRAFTILLDPPDYAMPKSTAAPAAEESSTALAPAVPAKKTLKKSSETGAPARPPQPETADYGPVAAGETLWSVASRLRADPAITMDQMQLALYKANPKAFENGRIGSLLKGVTLKVPTEKTIRSVSPEKAKSLVRQLRSGRSLSRSQNGRKPEVLKAAEESKPTAPPAQELAAPVAKPSTPSSPSPAPVAKSAEAASAVEVPAKTPASAMNPATAVAASAVVSMPASAVATGAPAAAETVSAVADGTVEAASGTVAEPVSAQAVEPIKPYIPPPILTEPAPVPLMEEFEGPIKLAGGVAVIASLLGWILLGRKKKAKVAPKTEPRKPFNWKFWKKAEPEGSSLASVKFKSDNKKTPEAVAMPAAAFDEAEFERDYEATQKSSGGKFPSETQKLEQTMSDTSALPNFDSTKIFDTPPDVALSDINTDAVDFDVTSKFEAETLKIDLNSNDPVAEADFHLAYGLYDEAALQLKQAAQKQPNRMDIRTKLAEVYFRAGKAAEFQDVAEGLKSLLSPTEWTKVALMGKQLNPDSPLFQGVDVSALSTDMDMAFDEPAPVAVPTSAARSSAPATMDFELTSLDLPKVEEPKRMPAADAGNSLEFNLDDFALDTAAPSAPAPAAATAVDAPMEFDLSAFDVGTSDAASSVSIPSSADEIRLDDFDLGVSENGHALSTGDEASTKLDLARAYVDMGDNDMARSLLNEVLQQGSAVQKTEAQALLSRLA